MKISRLCLCAVTSLSLVFSAMGADLVKAKDPEGVKRYEGSVLIAYLPPKHDEYFAATGNERKFSNRNPFGETSLKLEGLVERWTYLLPDTNRTSFEVFSNYRDEFKRLGLEIVYAPDPDEDRWFGPAYDSHATAAKLSQILAYNEEAERYMVAKTQDANPTYYVLFVTAYQNGLKPDALDKILERKMPLVQLDIITPAGMEEKMVFVKAEEMASALAKSGHIALYGLNFDTDKDTLNESSRPSLDEVARLLKDNASLKVHVVGHTDNQGAADYNLNLSHRRAKSIVDSLVKQYGITPSRLSSFGAGLYAPISSNEDEAGRAQNRRVELVEQ